jgi:hypothetical protein
LLTPVDQERGRREPVALERTALPWRALAESIAWWSCAEEVIVMIAGERFYAAASIASPRHDQDCPPACRSGAATDHAYFIAAQTTPGGDAGVKSSITLPCATSS